MYYMIFVLLCKDIYVSGWNWVVCFETGPSCVVSIFMADLNSLGSKPHHLVLVALWLTHGAAETLEAKESRSECSALRGLEVN